MHRVEGPAAIDDCGSLLSVVVEPGPEMSSSPSFLSLLKYNFALSLKKSSMMTQNIRQSRATVIKSYPVTLHFLLLTGWTISLKYCKDACSLRRNLLSIFHKRLQFFVVFAIDFLQKKNKDNKTLGTHAAVSEHPSTYLHTSACCTITVQYTSYQQTLGYI